MLSRIGLRAIIQKFHSVYLPYCWAYLFPPAAILSLELTFEKTYLTRAYGYPMVGFAFSYVFPPAVLICIFAVYLCYLWLALVAATSLIIGSLPRRTDLVKASAVAAALLLERIPVEAWQAFLSLMLGSPERSGLGY